MSSAKQGWGLLWEREVRKRGAIGNLQRLEAD